MRELDSSVEDSPQEVFVRTPDEWMAELWSYRGASYRLAYHITQRSALAEEALQESYLHAWRTIKSGQRPPEALKSWFLRVTANCAKGAIRTDARRGRREDLAVVEPAPTVRIASPLEPDCSRLIAAAFRNLQEEYRLPLCLCYELGLSQREAAEMLNLTPQTVSRRVRYGLNRLRKLLKESGLALSLAALPDLLKAAAPQHLVPDWAVSQRALLAAARGETRKGLSGRVSNRNPQPGKYRALGKASAWKAPPAVFAMLSVAMVAVAATAVWAFVSSAALPVTGEPGSVPSAMGGGRKSATSEQNRVPYAVHWDFTKGPASDIVLLEGKWEWQAATRVEPAGMFVLPSGRGPHAGAAIELKAPLVENTLCVTFSFHIPERLASDPATERNGIAFNLAWMSGKQGQVTEARGWRERDFLTNRSKSHTYRFFVTSKYILSLAEGRVRGLSEYAQLPLPRTLFLSACNIKLQSLSVAEMAHESLPKACQAPELLRPEVQSNDLFSILRF